MALQTKLSVVLWVFHSHSRLSYYIRRGPRWNTCIRDVSLSFSLSSRTSSSWFGKYLLHLQLLMEYFMKFNLKSEVTTRLRISAIRRIHFKICLGGHIYLSRGLSSIWFSLISVLYNPLHRRAVCNVQKLI